MRWTPRMLLVVACVTCAGTPWAQTEADKATARALAEQGVRLKHKQQYEQALGNLQRAQKIYDAPTHLLLIAQCQVALGKLVEGAETYRELLRRKLPANAPAAFQTAQEQARTELEQVEARIPSIRIGVQPDPVRGLQLRIDGVAAPSAVVGVDRLINPGHHVLEATAPAYRPAQVQVQVSEGQHVPVHVVLQPEPAAVAPSVLPGSRNRRAPAGYGEQAKLPENPRRKKRNSKWELVGALRLQGVVSAGDLGTMKFNDSEVESGEAAREYAGGGGLELQGGLRFANHFAALLLGGVDGFGPVDEDSYRSDLSPLLGDGSTGYEVTATTAPYFGVAGQYYSCKDCTSFVAELALTGRVLTQQLQYKASAVAAGNCEAEVSRSATMARILGGVDIPISGIFRLMPYASVAAGGIGQMRVTAKGGAHTCQDDQSYESNGTVEDASLVIFGLGVSGSIALGLD
ncbi:MAG: hypothetical protein MUF54_03855 [Polyangiaceae bacterium]|nr:hypothetical protein [Polyangiaceae bacterium]